MTIFRGRWRKELIVPGNGLVVIREAFQPDWPEISRVSRESGYVDYINEIGPTYINWGKTLVCADSRIDGFLKMEFLPDRSIYLSGLRVSPEARRKGVGIALTEYALQEARSGKMKVARLLIEPGNVPSLALAKKIGFNEIRAYHFFVGNIDVSNLKPAPSGDDVINAGWTFYRAGGPDSEYYSGDVIRVALFKSGEAWNHGQPYFTVLSGEELVINEGNGLVSVPDELLNMLTGEPKKNPGFEKALLLEKSL